MDSLEERYGNWIETYTGIHFYPMDPRMEDIDRIDIAHALSQVCRFTGHTRWFYSVGQHSLLCAEYARLMGRPAAVQLRALLHDASEAYICDVARPVKPYLRGYADIEADIMKIINYAFGLPMVDPAADAVVKEIDDRMLHMEARRLMPVAAWATMEGDETISLMIGSTPIRLVKELFLAKLGQLQKEMDMKEE